MKSLSINVLTIFVLGLLWPTPAYAYLDPASGSLILQLILGGVAGLMVIGKLFWHKVQRLLPWKREEEQDGSSDV